MPKIDTNTILMTIVGSLTAYVFYGHINLEAKVDTIDTKQIQVMSEQRDIWTKYNDDLREKVVFMKEYYEHKEEEKERWIEYWKEKAQDK